MLYYGNTHLGCSMQLTTRRSIQTAGTAPPTPTPTTTPTPSGADMLINPIITENDEYIEVGDNEYLMF
jgi:hypothetical protein